MWQKGTVGGPCEGGREQSAGSEHARAGAGVGRLGGRGGGGCSIDKGVRRALQAQGWMQKGHGGGGWKSVVMIDKKTANGKGLGGRETEEGV